MDDLYDNLENYNDLAELEELKKENQELKFKLAEYDSRLEKLQKDFDKVSIEFKNLEINYSSLLKTAKAEIERKTQLITSLNAEKDRLVLNSLQTSNKNISNIRRNLTRACIGNVNVKKVGNETDDSSKKSLLFVDTRNRSQDRNRNDENRYPSVDTASSVNTDDTNKFIKKTESVVYQNTEVPKPKPLSIKDRRKSMPVVSLPKYSSDEENNNSADDYERRRLVREDNRSLIPNRPPIKQPRDKNSNHDRYNRSDKFRGGRKPRHRRNFSPDRRRLTELSPDRHRRIEDDRHDRRSRFESPPPDRYDPRKRRRSNYERDTLDDRHRTRDIDRHENYTFKPKIHGEYEEPTVKRARIESYPYGDETLRSRRPPEFVEERAPSRNSQFSQHETCQSPDLSNPDVVSPHPVREILDNAATRQEDPRLLSNKYVKKCEGDKVFLSTCSGRNVDLVPINPTVWEENKEETPKSAPETPKALQETPATSEEIIKDIYLNIENPVSNMSFESGEVLSETTDTATPDIFYGRDELDRRYEFEPNHTLIPQATYPDSNLNRDISPTNSAGDITEPRLQQHKPMSVDTTLEPTTRENTKKFCIAKIKQPDKTKSCTADKNPLALLLNEIQDAPPVVDFSDPVPKSKSMPSGKPKKLDVDTVYSRRQAEKKRKEKLKNKETIQISRTSRELVAGDLELSDETSDNIDLHNRVVAENSAKSKRKNFDDENTKDIAKELSTVTKNIDKIEPKTSSPENQTETSKISQEVVKVQTDISPDDKNKPKKKSHKKTAKDKEVHSTDKKSKCKEKVVDKKGKSKENVEEKTPKPTEELPKYIEKSKVKEIKTTQKFHDLFGDCSSLITPEDLGLIPVAETVPCASNLPIFEDAQDAIDIKDQPNKAIELKVIEPDIKQNIDRKEATNLKDIADRKATNAKNLYLYPNVDDSGVVDTVIISSGVQNQVPETDSPVPDVIENVDKNHLVPMALATSTPHKNLLNMLSEVETQSVDSSCSRNEGHHDTSSHSSISNGLDSHNAPDVRIFMRRRKKIIKKN